MSAVAFTKIFFMQNWITGASLTEKWDLLINCDDDKNGFTANQFQLTSDAFHDVAVSSMARPSMNIENYFWFNAPLHIDFIFLVTILFDKFSGRSVYCFIAQLAFWLLARKSLNVPALLITVYVLRNPWFRYCEPCEHIF